MDIILNKLSHELFISSAVNGMFLIKQDICLNIFLLWAFYNEINIVIKIHM